MNTNNIFNFVAGIVVGVGGTMLIDYFLKRRGEADEWEYENAEEDDSLPEIGRSTGDINPPKSSIAPKPDIQEVVDYGTYANLTKTYNSEGDEKKNAFMKETIEKVADEGYKKNVFEEAAKTGTLVSEKESSSYSRKDATPPKYRIKAIESPMDIQQISKEQFLQPILGYDKCSCTYYVNQQILAGCNDKLDVMDVGKTVGQDILDQFEEDKTIEVLFVSNISTEIDYEILISSGVYEEEKAELMAELGDEEWQEELSTSS